MKVLFLYINIFLLCISCSSSGTKIKKIKKVVNKKYFISSEVEGYFLPLLPSWANYSTLGRCYRSTDINFLNFKSLRKSYNLTYEQAIQVQAGYNDYIFRKKENNGSDDRLPFEKKEKKIYSLIDEVQSDIKIFRSPKYNIVNIVWLDYALGNKKTLERLLKLAKTQIFREGHPIILSRCLQRYEAENFIKKYNFPLSTRIISAEMFSTYSSKNLTIPFLGLNITELVGKNKRVNLFIPRKSSVGKELDGVFDILRY